MTAATDTGAAKAPWHLWLVGVVSLLWNAIGAYDYTMSHLQGETYYRQMHMTDSQIAFMGTYPTWMHAVWAIGVWGAVAGSVLLLLRMRWAFHAFVLSALGAAGALLYAALGPGGAGGAKGLVMPAVIVAVSLFLVWYSWTVTKRGVLR
jgi:hypothetical protein